MIMPSPQDGSSIPKVEVPKVMPSQSPEAEAFSGSDQFIDIRVEEVASWEAPHDVAPMHRLPLASREVPFANMTSVDGSIMSLAPGEMMMSSTTLCVPDQTSTALMYPALVSF